MANEDSIEGDKGRGQGEGSGGSKDDHECNLLCFMCQRPWDTFRHVHLTPDVDIPKVDEDNGRELVLCIPCMAHVATHLAPVLSAYMQGGISFDTYEHRVGRVEEKGRGGRGRGRRTPMPKYIEDIMGEIQKQMDDNDAGI